MRFVIPVSLLTTSAFALEANPMRRIINILQDTQKELEEEGRKEEKLMANFECYCKKNLENMGAEAEAAKAKILELTAKLDSEKAAKKTLDQELVQHKSDRASAKKDLAKAVAIRKKEQESYDEATSEQKANIDALNRAVKAIAKGTGQAFMQSRQGSTDSARLYSMVSMNQDIDRFEKRMLLGFFQSPYGAYSTQSGEITGILSQLKDEMDKELGGAISREEEAVSQFQELKAAKKKEIQAHTDAIESKTIRTGELAVSVVSTANDLKTTKANLSDTVRFLAELSITCDGKASEYSERLQTRADEISSISTAIKILNDDDALDLFKGTLDKSGAPASFLQKSRMVKAPQLMQAVANLKSTGNAYGNLIASLIQSKNVDFTKVIAMIENMVKVLAKEQTDDNSHRDYCREEFNASDNNLKDSGRSLSNLDAEIEDSQAAADDAASEISTAQDEIKNLDQAVAEATEQRKDEHEAFVQSSTELTSAVQLIEKAVNALNKFYNPALYKAPQENLTEEQRIAQNLGQEVTAKQTFIAGTSQTVDIQVHKAGDKPVPPPETFGAYQKKDGKSGGVVALLNKFKEELKVDQTSGEHEEKTAQKDYEDLMQDSREKRQSLTVRITDLETTKADLEERIQNASQSHSNETDNLNELKQYKSELHASCDFLLKNFDVRNDARAAETEALKNAKAVLSGANFA